MFLTVNYIEDTKQLIVECDTFWSCACDGNILLSKYSGVPTEEGVVTEHVIDVIETDEVLFSEGTVYFTYGGDNCHFPEVKIMYTNWCNMTTAPNYVNCVNSSGKTEKAIYLQYMNSHDTLTVYVDTPVVGGWSVQDNGGRLYYVDGNKLIIVAGDGSSDFVIKPNKCEDDTKYIRIKLYKI